MWWDGCRSGLQQWEDDLESSEIGESYVCKEPFSVFLSFPELKTNLREELISLMYSEAEQMLGSSCKRKLNKKIVLMQRQGKLFQVKP